MTATSELHTPPGAERAEGWKEPVEGQPRCFLRGSHFVSPLCPERPTKREEQRSQESVGAAGYL